MKKNGFTLAEVLVTMGIIGVITALTLPALNTNMKEKAAITKYKRAYMTLNNVGQILSATNDYDFSDLEAPGEGGYSANIGNDSSGVMKKNLYAVLDKYAKLDRDASAKLNKSVVFSDGTVFIIDDPISPEGYKTYITGIIDVNGAGGPDNDSSCDDEGCTSGKKIKDRFRITLMDDKAVPGGVKQKVGSNTYEAVSGTNDKQNYAANWVLNQ